jgi:hypothetical protein
MLQMIRESAAASIGIVKKACQQIQDSPALQQILRMVLATGNLLNTGTKQGNAQGFKLASLLKLADSKVPPIQLRIAKGRPDYLTPAQKINPAFPLHMAGVWPTLKLGDDKHYAFHGNVVPPQVAVQSRQKRQILTLLLAMIRSGS